MKCEAIRKHVVICDSCFTALQEVIMAEIARRAGSVTSVRKARASRKNGKLGGRPRKK